MAAVARTQPRIPLKESKTAPAAIPQLQHFPSTKPLDFQGRSRQVSHQEAISYAAERPHIQAHQLSKPEQQEQQQSQRRQQEQAAQQYQRQSDPRQHEGQQPHDSPETSLPPVTPPAGLALGIPFHASIRTLGAESGVGGSDRGTPPSQKQPPPPYSAHPQPPAHPQMNTYPSTSDAGRGVQPGNSVTGMAGWSPIQPDTQPHISTNGSGQGTSPTLRRTVARVPAPTYSPQGENAKDVRPEASNESLGISGQATTLVPPGRSELHQTRSSPTTARQPPPSATHSFSHANQAGQLKQSQGEHVFPSGDSPDSRQGQGRGQTPPSLRRVVPQRGPPSSTLLRRESSGNVLSSFTDSHFPPTAPNGPRARTNSTSLLDALSASQGTSSSDGRTTPTSYHSAMSSLPSSAFEIARRVESTTEHSEPFPFNRERMDLSIQARLVSPPSSIAGGTRSVGQGANSQARTSARGTPDQPVDDRDDEGDEHAPGTPTIESNPRQMYGSSSEGTEYSVVKRYALSDAPSNNERWEGPDTGDQTPPPANRGRPSGNSQSLPHSSDIDGNPNPGPDLDYLEMETPRSIPSALPGEGNDFLAGVRYSRGGVYSWPTAASRSMGPGRHGMGEAFGVSTRNDAPVAVGHDPTHRYSAYLPAQAYGASMYDHLSPTTGISSLNSIIMGYQQGRSNNSHNGAAHDTTGRPREHGPPNAESGHMAQPLPKHPFPFRDLDLQTQLRAQVTEMQLGRMGLTMHPDDEQWMAWASNDHDEVPTREGSVGTSFEGNMDLIMPYIGRPAAPIPPTPFTGTAAPTPANDAHLRQQRYGNMPALPEYANVYPPALFPHEPGPVTDSTLSSPYQGDPFLPYHIASAHSTPSVRGLNLAALDSTPIRTRYPASGLGSRPGQIHPVYSHARPPSSVSGESAEPQDTESEGEEDDDDVWLDEASDDELDAEFHHDYIADKITRRTRFETKMRALVRQFRELDRSTDATMLLIASNPDQRHTHFLLSRSVRRHPNYVAFAQSARQTFSQVADSRRVERASRARMLHHQQRAPAVRRKSSTLPLSSGTAVAPMQDKTVDNRRSTSSGSDTTSGSVTGRGTTSSETSLELLKTLQAIDPTSMSAQDFRVAVTAELGKLQSVDGGLKQHVQGQPDSTEELRRRAINQYAASGLFGRDGADIVWRSLQGGRSLSSTDISGTDGLEIR